MRRKQISVLLGWVLGWSLAGAAVPAAAEQFRLGIMQDEKGVAQKYAPLADYLRTKGIEVSFASAPDYVSAAKMFASGDVDGMFSGSGVAGVMLIKELAIPAVRPISKEGFSTYWGGRAGPQRRS